MKHLRRNTLKTLILSIALFSALAHTQNKPVVTLHTSMGNIVLELNADRAPVTVANFLKHINSGFYENTIFHRVIPRFMIQGGGFNAGLEQKETLEAIINESNNRWHNERGTIAMARTNDPDSATSQFFINVRMNARLDYRYRQPGYTVFGKVIEGMDVVDNISYQETQPKGRHQNVPIKPIVIEKVTLADQQVSL